MGQDHAVTEFENRQLGDNRQVGRDSLFLMADLRVERSAGDHRIKVRNLSARGMMAEGTVKVMAGIGVEVSLRNIGWVPGRVAWIQDNRFGIAFLDDIDPKLVRAAPQGAGEGTPRYLKSTALPPDPSRLRKL
ncbi:hypothetical protein Y88_3575 [Novosphingobium nitrogenifigens DSM 19370]|uniref:PilZ domain-containing protein n=1 Tax=Novosphingobium nitrogenifigens DSM 19370 TaxID=983920 RepID=F1ZDJ3_9SPHN|nr:PilZ domain-containing protein [Novosphingobium nitrogenifigens]EGD57266.1 hypothetical protein Y88_3575 [Novosphingobium nitrogenifigens DSM 19370]